MEQFVLQFIKSILDNNVMATYGFFFVSCALQLVFPPFPSDVVLIFQGYVTSISSHYNPIYVMLNAMSGTLLGAYLVYKFGYVNGARVFEFKFVKRFIDEKHKKRAEKLFEKYGPFAIFISKFVPGVNSIIILFAGVFRQKARNVMIPAFFSVLIHHLAVLILGRYLGNNLEQVKRLVSTYNLVIAILAAILIILWVLYRLLVKGMPKPVDFEKAE